MFSYSKRQTHEECDSLHREVESLRTRMVKTEVEISGQQADSREMTRRLDRLDRVNGYKFIQLNIHVPPLPSPAHLHQDNRLIAGK